MNSATAAGWQHSEAHGCEVYAIGAAFVTLEPRPHYCDRVHWIGKVFNVADVDDADSFPRYFMDRERARAELKDWLHWRLKVPNGQQGDDDGRSRKV